MTALRVNTPFGALVLLGSDLGLRRILWPGEPASPFDTAGVATLQLAADQLHGYFAGELGVFDLPLDLVGTRLQVEAWRGLAGIPYGTTTTYAAYARRLGRPNAARAVGSANARNPLPIVLPCHRLVGSCGELRGYGGGVDVKRALIEHEATALLQRADRSIVRTP